MKIVGVCVVRNEMDLIPLTLRHHCRLGLDHLYVGDHGSTDGTTDVLNDLSRELPLTWERFARESDLNCSVRPHLANRAARDGVDWVVPFDADEFWVVDGDFRHTLAGTAGPVLRVWPKTFVQRHGIEEAKPNALLTMNFRVPHGRTVPEIGREQVVANSSAYVELNGYPKILYRPLVGAELGPGAHRLRGFKGTPLELESLGMLHAPLRAKNVLKEKACNGQFLDRLFPQTPGTCWHWRRWGKMLAAGILEAEWAANSHREGALHLHAGPRPLVPDSRLVELATALH